MPYAAQYNNRTNVASDGAASVATKENNGANADGGRVVGGCERDASWKREREIRLESRRRRKLNEQRLQKRRTAEDEARRKKLADHGKHKEAYVKYLRGELVDGGGSGSAGPGSQPARRGGAAAAQRARRQVAPPARRSDAPARRSDAWRGAEDVSGRRRIHGCALIPHRDPGEPDRLGRAHRPILAVALDSGGAAAA